MPEENQVKQPNRRRLFVGLGCLSASCLAIALLAVLASRMRLDISKGLDGLGRTLFLASIGQMMVDAGIPEEEAIASLEEFAELTSGDSLEQEQRNGLTKGVVAVVIAHGVEKIYVPASKLAEDERSAGLVTAARFARAASSSLLTDQDIETTLDMVEATEADIPLDADEYEINRVLKKSLTDAELRDLLAKMKTIADNCGIGEVPSGIDLKSEIARIMEQVRGARPKEEAPAP